MTDARTLQSLGCYLGMVLLVGQLVLRALGIPIERLFLFGTLVMIFAPMFGTEFVIALVKAVRGARDDEPGPNDA
jgi:hypothetical protein